MFNLVTKNQSFFSLLCFAFQGSDTCLCFRLLIRFITFYFGCENILVLCFPLTVTSHSYARGTACTWFQASRHSDLQCFVGLSKFSFCGAQKSHIIAIWDSRSFDRPKTMRWHQKPIGMCFLDCF